MESRDRGSPRRCGSSHASALTWTTRLGGKAGFTPAPRLSFHTGDSRKVKPLPPFADDLERRVEPGRDEVIGQAFVGKKNDPGTDYVTIRRRISSGHGLQRRP